MRSLFLIIGFTGFSAAGFGHSDVLKNDEIAMSAISQTSEGAVRTLVGNAQLETSAVIVKADRVVYNADTQQIKALGNVQITLKSR